MNTSKTDFNSYYNYNDGVLYVWIEHKFAEKKSSGSLKVRLDGNIVLAYDFEGDVKIEDVAKGKQIFIEYEGL